VALLNRAGIETFQSCQDIGPDAVIYSEFEDDEITVNLYAKDEETRYCCIVVTWDQFPKVGRVLPGLWIDRVNHYGTGGYSRPARTRGMSLSCSLTGTWPGSPRRLRLSSRVMARDAFSAAPSWG
jgi:hypothetical protein